LESAMLWAKPSWRRRPRSRLWLCGSWQTVGGTDDVMRLVDCRERADVAWCAIGGVAVNHWAAQPMVTQDVDFVVVSSAIDRTVSLLKRRGPNPRGVRANA